MAERQADNFGRWLQQHKRMRWVVMIWVFFFARLLLLWVRYRTTSAAGRMPTSASSS